MVKFRENGATLGPIFITPFSSKLVFVPFYPFQPITKKNEYFEYGSWTLETILINKNNVLFKF